MAKWDFFDLSTVAVVSHVHLSKRAFSEHSKMDGRATVTQNVKRRSLRAPNTFLSPDPCPKQISLLRCCESRLSLVGKNQVAQGFLKRFRRYTCQMAHENVQPATKICRIISTHAVRESKTDVAYNPRIVLIK